MHRILPPVFYYGIGYVWGQSEEGKREYAIISAYIVKFSLIDLHVQVRVCWYQSSKGEMQR